MVAGLVGRAGSAHAVWGVQPVAANPGGGRVVTDGDRPFGVVELADAALLPELASIRSRIEATAREICGPKDYLVSASVGACACPVGERPSLEQLLVEADRALYGDKARRSRPRPE